MKRTTIAVKLFLVLTFIALVLSVSTGCGCLEVCIEVCSCTEVCIEVCAELCGDECMEELEVVCLGCLDEIDPGDTPPGRDPVIREPTGCSSGCENGRTPLDNDSSGCEAAGSGFLSCIGSDDSNGSDGSSGGNRPGLFFNRLTIELDKTIYEPGEVIIVTVNNLPRHMNTAGAFVAIYDEGDEHFRFMEYQYPDTGNSVLEFTAPFYNGRFEMRLYNQDNNYTDEAFELSVPFRVR